jgi:hypothetical protein
MCLACQEEAFYQAYLDYMAKKAKEAAAAPVTEGAAKEPAVCDDVKDRVLREAPGKQ